MKSGDSRQFTIEVDRGPTKIVVVRIEADFYALGDTCSHANYSLSEGEVAIEDRTVMCWKHGSEFSLTSGLAMNLPATRPVRVYALVVEGQDLMVVIP